jgi:hypothetical protein
VTGVTRLARRGGQRNPGQPSCGADRDRRIPYLQGRHRTGRACGAPAAWNGPTEPGGDGGEPVSFSVDLGVAQTSFDGADDTFLAADRESPGWFPTERKRVMRGWAVPEQYLKSHTEDMFSWTKNMTKRARFEPRSEKAGSKPLCSASLQNRSASMKLLFPDPFSPTRKFSGPSRTSHKAMPL